LSLFEAMATSFCFLSSLPKKQRRDFNLVYRPNHKVAIWNTSDLWDILWQSLKCSGRESVDFYKRKYLLIQVSKLIVTSKNRPWKSSFCDINFKNLKWFERERERERERKKEKKKRWMSAKCSNYKESINSKDWG
jgi:hypothetical protein